MPDDDDENWRTLIDTAATEYAGESRQGHLGLIAQSEGNTQARTILAGRGFPKAAASNAERTWRHLPGADGTYGFNLRLLGRLKDDVDYFSAHYMRRNTCGPAARGRADRETPRDRRDNQAGRPSRMASPRSGSTRPNGDERPVRQYGNSP